MKQIFNQQVQSLRKHNALFPLLHTSCGSTNRSESVTAWSRVLLREMTFAHTVNKITFVFMEHCLSLVCSQKPQTSPNLRTDQVCATSRATFRKISLPPVASVFQVVPALPVRHQQSAPTPHSPLCFISLTTTIPIVQHTSWSASLRTFLQQPVTW